MDSFQHSENPTNDNSAAQTPVKSVESQFESEFDSKADWESLEATLSWESEQGIVGNADPHQEPFQYLSVCR
jgi:hypothetical protein